LSVGFSVSIFTCELAALRRRKKNALYGRHMETKPTHLKIRYRGKLIGNQWVYDKPKVVELPVPFLSRSEKEGEVVCDPIGVFDYETGKKLLEKAGKDGAFVLEEEVYPQGSRVHFTNDEGDPSNANGSHEPDAPTLDRWGNVIQKKTPEEKVLIHRRINRAKLSRGQRQRAVRSDKGKPKPRNKDLAAVTPVQAQADSDESSPENPADSRRSE